MPDNQTLANNIRAAVENLRAAIVAARAASLTVEIPLMLGHWLDTGTPPGEPAVWTIKPPKSL